MSIAFLSFGTILFVTMPFKVELSAWMGVGDCGYPISCNFVHTQCFEYCLCCQEHYMHNYLCSVMDSFIAWEKTTSLDMKNVSPLCFLLLACVSLRHCCTQPGLCFVPGNLQLPPPVFQNSLESSLSFLNCFWLVLPALTNMTLMASSLVLSMALVIFFSVLTR